VHWQVRSECTALQDRAGDGSCVGDQDYRFRPVEESELKDLEIEISVLTPLRKIGSIDEFQLGKHGIYIRKDSVRDIPPAGRHREPDGRRKNSSAIVHRTKRA